MWHDYLCYCEALFEERYVGVLQTHLDRPHCRRTSVSATSERPTTAGQEVAQ